MARALRALGQQAELFFFRRGLIAGHVPSDVRVHFGDLAEFLALTRAGAFDVVHAAVDDRDTGVSAVTWIGPRLVATVHGRVTPGWSSRNCDALVGCSRWCAEAQAAVTDLPVPVIVNGVDLDRFVPPDGPPRGPPVVAWVGRGADLEQKRIDRLAAIAPALARAGVRVWVADPDGPSRAPCGLTAVLERVAERWSAVPVESMAAFFQAVAASGGCVLSTSAFEGLSMAYLEAQACGCPVLGPDVPGVREGVDPSLGGLYSPHLTPEAAAEFVLAALRDREGMARRRRACRAFVAERFDFVTTARRYVELYRRVVSVPRRARRVWVIPPFTPAAVRRYVGDHWTPAVRQFEASQKLAARGDHWLAWRTFLSSLATCPSIYLRPRRLARLLRAAGTGATRHQPEVPVR
ncbi:glycosyltransferase family 4 protein [bacterium]|nr:glycosyltransferase family 4 protein [bacterium]